MWKFEKEFRKDNPQTIGETDSVFDLENYRMWLEGKLQENLLEKEEQISERDLLLAYELWINDYHSTKERENQVDTYLATK